jgi:hypothetical protein
VKSRTVQESAAALGDKDCIYCGASLAGLTAHDRCPECGKPAVDSLLQNYLRDSDHEWLRTILRGITFMVMGYAGLILASSVAIAEDFVKADVFDAHFYRLFVDLFAEVMLALGVWFLTAHEPGESLVARRRTLPWLARIAVIVMVLAVALPLVQIELHEHVARAVWFAGSIALLLSFMLPWIHLRRLVDRTPRREVGRMLTSMAWLSLVLLAVGIAWDVLAPRVADVAVRHWAHVGAMAALILFAAAAVYVLTLASRGIRRTVGYWT